MNNIQVFEGNRLETKPPAFSNKEERCRLLGHDSSGRRLQELISITFNRAEKSGKPSSDDLAQLSSYLESHAPEEWILVKDAVRKAEAFKTAGQGSDYLNQWTQICNVLTPAVTKKVRTDISLKTP